MPGAKPDGVLIYTIALGKNSVCSNGNYTPPPAAALLRPAPAPIPSMVIRMPAEQLLRYVADMGDDGNPTTGPCLDPNTQPSNARDPNTKVEPDGRSDDVGLGLQCGNYYFAPDASRTGTHLPGNCRAHLYTHHRLMDASAAR